MTSLVLERKGQLPLREFPSTVRLGREALITKRLDLEESVRALAIAAAPPPADVKMQIEFPQ